MLRDYQQRAIDQLYDWFEGHSIGDPCLDLPTGSGKSWIIAALCKDALTNWPSTRVLMLTHIRELIQQNADKLREAWPGAPMGICAASMRRYDTHEPITFASVQTVRNRVQNFSHIDLCIIDECHLMNNDDQGTYRTIINALRDINPRLRVIGLTATPWRLGQGLLTEGKKALFDDILEPVTIEELVHKGYLCRLSSKPTDKKLDTSGVKKRGGEYIEGQLGKALDQEVDNQEAVQETINRAGDRKSWLVFCAGVDHSYHIRDELRAQGVSAETVTGKTPKGERQRIIDDFKEGRITALTNANVLCLDEQTEILTSSGWSGIDDMSPNHQVAAWDFDGSIKFAPPKNIVRRQRFADENMVSVESKRNSIRVTGNHRMIVRERYTNWRIKSAEAVADQRVFIPTSGSAKPFKPVPAHVEISEKKRASRIRSLSYVYRKRGMPAAQAKEEAEAHVEYRSNIRAKKPDDLTIDDCLFIGFWLGDGTLSSRCEFSQSWAYPKIIHWFDSLLAQMEIAHSRNEGKATNQLPHGYVRWSIARGTGGSHQFRENGYFPLEPYLNKNGSNLFWGLCEDQFEALLTGLWMADGNHGDGGKASSGGNYVAGTQGNLFDLLQAIGVCRGYRFTKTPLSSRNNAHSKQWRLSWRKCDAVELVSDRFQVEEDNHAERAWCVTSATGNIIIRRNGKVSVVGNTTGFDHPDTDLIVMLRPTMSPVLYVQMAGRGLRPKSHIDHCLVLDFAGNVEQHGPITAVQPPKRKGQGGGEAPVKLCPECAEILHMSVKQCSECGYVFIPEDKPQKWRLSDGDIMGDEIRELHVTDWQWREHISRTTGNQMVKVTYYGSLSDKPITEYLPVANRSRAGSDAVQKVYNMAEQSGASLASASDMQKLCDAMNASGSPSLVTYKMEGKWPQVIDRQWSIEDGRKRA